MKNPLDLECVLSSVTDKEYRSLGREQLQGVLNNCQTQLRKDTLERIQSLIVKTKSSSIMTLALFTTTVSAPKTLDAY